MQGLKFVGALRIVRRYFGWVSVQVGVGGSECRRSLSCQSTGRNGGSRDRCCSEGESFP